MKNVSKSNDFIFEEVRNIIPAIFKALQKKYNDLKFKTEEELGLIYTEYLEYAYSKYSTVKTLLYKNEAKPLYNFYENVKLKNDRMDSVCTDNSNQIFDESNNVIITGTGGIGKSMLIKHIFVNQIQQQSSIPIFIELKAVNDFNIEDRGLEDFVYDMIKSHHLDIEKEYFIETLKMGKYLLLFDGLDEVSAVRRTWLNESIKKFVDVYNKNRYVISSRPSEEFIGWTNFTEYEMEKLSKEQALSLIDKLDYDPKVKRTFYKELKTHLYDKHDSFASIPLLLTIMLMTYESGASIPDNLTDFYNQAFYTLYQRHDASKSGYKRELKAELSPEEFKSVVAYIGMQTFINSQVDFDVARLDELLTRYTSKYYKRDIKTQDFIHDATSNACMMIQEGTDIKFAHRSFQEYFAAIGINQLEDSLQKKILIKWVKEDRNNIFAHKTFLNTLFSIQKERTYKNLCIPVIEEMDRYIEQFPNVDELTQTVFKFFRKREFRNKVSKLLFLLDEDVAYYFYLQFTIFNNIGVELEDLENHQISQEVEAQIIAGWKNEEKKTWDELSEVDLMLIRKWVEYWYLERHNFLKTWADEIKKQTSVKKRTLRTIMDEI